MEFTFWPVVTCSNRRKNVMNFDRPMGIGYGNGDVMWNAGPSKKVVHDIERWFLSLWFYNLWLHCVCSHFFFQIEIGFICLSIWLSSATTPTAAAAALRMEITHFLSLVHRNTFICQCLNMCREYSAMGMCVSAIGEDARLNTGCIESKGGRPQR